MEEYTLGLCILDFVPNLAFLTGAVFLVRLSLRHGNQVYSFATTLGSLLVFSGGMSKAIWKLVFWMRGLDLTWLGEAQFVLMAPGFLLLLISAAGVFVARQRAARPLPFAAMAGWKIPFLAIMVLSNLGLLVLLAFTALRKAGKLPALLFGFSALGVLLMGALASGQQSVSQQWIEESVNTLGQLSFAWGCFLLDRKPVTNVSSYL